MSFVSESYLANEVKRYAIKGRFFRIISGDVGELRLKRGGRYIDEDFQSITTGFSWEALPGEAGFDEVEVKCQTYAQTIKIAISTGKVGFADSVNVNNAVRTSPRALAFTQTAPAVTNTSAQIVAANSIRSYLLIQNKSSTGTVWINTTGAAATQANGVRLLPGQSLELIAVATTAAIMAIGDIASNPDVVVIEAS